MEIYLDLTLKHVVSIVAVDTLTHNMHHVSTNQCKTAVTPLLMQWSYHSLGLSHQYHHGSIILLL